MRRWNPQSRLIVGLHGRMVRLIGGFVVVIDSVKRARLDKGGYYRGRYFGRDLPLYVVDVVRLNENGTTVGFETVYVRASNAESARAVVVSVVERRGWGGLSLYR